MSGAVAGAPPPYDERRPQAGAASCVEAGQPTDRATVPLVADSLGAQLRRRRDAAWRCEPLPPNGSRDPLDGSAGPRPSDYGLSPHEVAAEVERCRVGGWRSWEIVQRFATRPPVAA